MMLRLPNTGAPLAMVLALAFIPAALVFLLSAAGGAGCGVRLTRAIEEQNTLAANVHWLEASLSEHTALQDSLNRLTLERNGLYWEVRRLRALLDREQLLASNWQD